MNNKRQEIIDTATRLFYASGYHAVGIDRVIAEAKVAKMTMYKHFASKTDLIEAVLKERDRRLQDSMFSFANSFRDPIDRLKAVFVWHDRWFNDRSFNGCMFISAAAEYPDPEDEIHIISRQHKQAIRDHLAGTLSCLVEKEGADRIAGQLLQLLDGAILMAQIFGDKNAALSAWRSAAAILKSEGVESSPSL